MNASDLKTKSKDELMKTLLDLKKEQMELRFQLSAAQLANTSQLRKVRRTIARVNTVLAMPAEETKAAAKKKTAKKTEKAA